MKSVNKKIIIFIFSLVFVSFSLNAQNTPKPYSDDEFSQTAKDIRRFEIISLGAIPFITFDAILIYSTIQWGRSNFEGGFPNPFSAKNYLSQDEITGIILTSIGISIGIAITDLIINKIKRNKIDQQQKKNILILPEEMNPIITESNIEESLQKTEDE